MNETTAQPSLNPPGYQIRRLQECDAEGVVACLRQIYGDSYVHPDLYRPEEIVRLNRTQELVSVVALDSGETVVGHYALERPGQRIIAEAGVALVLPHHRHHQLMEDMRVLLEQEARELELTGLFGHAVTNHVFTQKVDERFGEYPCAISLGWSPRTFHNMAEPLPQRMSELLYFKYLRPPQPQVVYLPQHHRDWCLRIYQELNVPITEGIDAPVKGRGKISVDVRADLGRAIIQVTTIGYDTGMAIGRALGELIAQKVVAIFLELPLAQPTAPRVCLAAEQFGFFFSGIGPSFLPDGDALRLQWLGEPLDTSLLLLESEFSKQLLAYIAAERARVTE